MTVEHFNSLRALWARISPVDRETYLGEAQVTVDEMDLDWSDPDVVEDLAITALRDAANWESGPEDARMTAAALLARADALRAPDANREAPASRS